MESRKKVHLVLILENANHELMFQFDQIINSMWKGDVERSLFCRVCLSSFNDGQTYNIGTLRLKESFPITQQCSIGHKLSHDDEQFFTSIDDHYEEIECPSHGSRTILDGAMHINCKDNPFYAKARICTFKEFEVLYKYMENNNMVSL